MGAQVQVGALTGPAMLAFAGDPDGVRRRGQARVRARRDRRRVSIRLAVGIAMVPRGEVGLIFAGIGATLVLDGRPILSAGLLFRARADGARHDAGRADGLRWAFARMPASSST